MPKLERPSMRRISTLDTIVEASSDSAGSPGLRSSAGVGGGRLSIGFSVNIPAHQRPQRASAKELGNSAPQLRLSMARRRSSRFRTSLCAVPDSTPSPPPAPRRRTSTFARTNEKTNDLTNAPATRNASGKPKKAVKASLPTSLPALEPTDSYIPSYARPTAASLAKAKRRCC